MSQFSFDEFAILTPGDAALFDARRQSIRAACQPGNILEEILAGEILHASWEAERVRSLNADTAHQSRASRTWNRSRKQLARLQSARASHHAELGEAHERAAAAQCPLADVSRLPKPIDFPLPEEAR